MSTPVKVQIIGAPIACEGGVKDTWRDLFDANCPPVPPGAELPLVLVNGEVLTNGGKISVPAIRQKIEVILEAASSADPK